MRNPQPSLIFSVDVECWAQSSLDSNLPIGEHSADNTRRIAEIIDEVSGATGTFFILGKFAEKHPSVVRELQLAGHEIACHGYGHVQLHLLTPAGFREDLRRAVGLISDITGERVVGYRAPVFSIGSQNLWALDVLADEGFRYDSSVFPIAGRRYGIPDWPHEPRSVRLGSGATIYEFPLTVMRLAGRNVPISGGGYARLLPGWMLRRCFSKAANGGKTWPVFYCHPYEIDPNEFSRLSPNRPWGTTRLSLKTRIHQGLGRRGFAEKIRLLMRSFRFRSFVQALSDNDTIPEICAAEFACPKSGKTPSSHVAQNSILI